MSLFTPIYQVMVNDEDITHVLSQRLISLTLTDNRGFEADTLTISIDDSDGQVNLPKRGATISVALGFKETTLIDKGDFIVDSIAHSGAPDVIQIGAKSADFRDKFIEQRNDSYQKTTIEAVISKIAERHQWQFKISESLKSITITDLQQANESDANLISRLAVEYDAIATIKKGTLLFLEAGSGKNASGDELPSITITRQDGDQHNYQISDRDAFTGVKAKYTTDSDGKRKEILVGEDEKTKMLRTTYKSADEAQIAAEKELKRLKRGVASFSFNLAVGNPLLLAGAGLKVQGFKKDIDDADWISVTVTHDLNDSGLVTSVEAEVRDD